MANKKIRKIESSIPQLPVQKLVAAYARVSCGKDAMMHSLSAQVSYFSNMIQRNPEWAYAGVYVDAPVIIGLKQNPTQTGAALVLFSLFTSIFETFR